MTDGLGIGLVYVIPYPAIFVAILLGVVTIYFSCFFVARKTAKISPIEGIRNNEDIKIKSKKLKAPKIIKVLFKAGGVIAYKNLKRNKKKYRVTVISMVLSVVMFMVMSSFINYTIAESGSHFGSSRFNIDIGMGSTELNFFDYTEDIINLIGDDEFVLVRSNIMRINNRYINFEVSRHIGIKEDNDIYINIFAIGDRAFREFVDTLGGNFEEYRNQGIFVDDRSIRDADGNFVEGYVYNVESSVELTGEIGTINLPIARKVSESPLNIMGSSYIVVSDEMIEELRYFQRSSHILVNSSDPDGLEEAVNQLNSNLFVNNFSTANQQMRNTVIVISIFLYGFIGVIITIGLTNIINTLTTSLNLRRKEFAMLKAIGTTSKEFRAMINLESIFLGTKVLLISIPIGMFLSYLIFHFLVSDERVGVSYNPNILAIAISVVSVFLIVKLIMSYSIKQINKQNIIDTIRNDNI